MSADKRGAAVGARTVARYLECVPIDRVDAVVNLSKRRGFVFPSSEIYGGTRSAWDYGPLGVELKENIRRQWWQSVVRGRDDVGPGPSVILAAGVGGVGTHRGVRRSADRVQEMPQALAGGPTDRGLRGEARAPAGERPRRHRVHQLRHAGEFTEPRDFNGMLRTMVGPDPGRGC